MLRYALSYEVRDALGGFLDLLDLDSESTGLMPENILSSQLRADGSVRRSASLAEASMMVYARLFDAADRTALLALLDRGERFFLDHPRSRGLIDAVLLTRGLFDDCETGAKSAEESRHTISEIDEYLTGQANSVSGLEIRIWIVSEKAQNGTTYRMADVASLLRLCTPLDLEQALGSNMGNYLTFGGRIVAFPRSRIQEHLADHYALRVLSLEERWLADGAVVHYAKVGKECSDFVRSVCVPLLHDMDKDADGKPLYDEPEMPAVQVSEPLAVVKSRIEAAVGDSMEKLGYVTTRIAENYEAVSGTIKDRIREQVASYADMRPSRTVMARAFMDVLEHGVTGLASGSQSSWSGQKMFQDSYTPSIEFLDELTGFDFSKREQLRDLNEDVESRMTQISQLEEDLEYEGSRLGDGESARTTTLRAAIEQARLDLCEKEQAKEDLGAEVCSQDLALDPTVNSRALRAALRQETQQGIDQALESLDKTAERRDTSLTRLRTVESEMESLLSSMILRFLLTVLVLLAVGATGLFVLPAVFGAVPVVGPPLFGFVGTAVAATWLRVWGVVSGVSLIVLLAMLFSTYAKQKGIIAEKQAELDAAEGACRAALRDYWEASVAGFTRTCELEKHLSILGLERSLRSFFEEERELLLRFEQAMRDMRHAFRERVEQFSLKSTVTELVIVGGDYAERLVNSKAKTLDAVAANFFSESSSDEAPVVRRSRIMSEYLDLFRRTGQLDQLLSDLREDCGAEVSWSLSASNVVKAAKEVDEGLSILKGAASSLTVLLPLDDRSRDSDDGPAVALSPDKTALEQALSSSSAFRATPKVLEHDDEERIVLLRIVHDIKREEIEALFP